MGKTIFIVEDEGGIRTLLKEICIEQGHHVMTAETGKEALEKLDNNQVDLLIIDYKLPVMSGMEVINKMEKRKISLPVILMSGMFESLENAIEESELIKSTLAKPFDVEELLNKMTTLLG